MKNDKIELDYDAISIDNNIFKQYGYRFDKGLLAQMIQFKESPVLVLQPDVIHNEAIKHIGEDISEIRGAIKRALKQGVKHNYLPYEQLQEATQMLNVEEDDVTVANNKMQKYYTDINATVFETSQYADHKKMMEMYFRVQPPFETKQEKKNEFPDAIALLGLEGWAKENDKKILAVSADKGWIDFAKDSEHITVISLLAEALEKFQPHNKVEQIIAKIKDDAFFETGNHVLTDITDAIKDRIEETEEYEMDIEAHSFHSYQCDSAHAEYVSHELEHKDKDIKIDIVSINNEAIVLRLGAMVKVDVSGEFSYTIYDSIDKDDVPLGSSQNISTEMFYTGILVTLVGDFSEDFESISVDEIEVLETIERVNFEEIGPHYEEDYEEKWEEFLASAH